MERATKAAFAAVASSLPEASSLPSRESVGQQYAAEARRLVSTGWVFSGRLPNKKVAIPRATTENAASKAMEEMRFR